MKALLIRRDRAGGVVIAPTIQSWCLAALALAATLGYPLFAQSNAGTWVIAFKSENRDRTVSGYLDAECASVRIPVQWHDPPWGNWGVSSNYGSKENGDQFKGWEPKGRQRQWNSCTAYPATKDHVLFRQRPVLRCAARPHHHPHERPVEGGGGTDIG